MKRLKLRKEVKEGMAIVFGIIVMIALVISIEISTNKAIDQCVNAGHSYSYCESGLR